MTEYPLTNRRKFSIGTEIGRAMAERIIELHHPQAMIIDNQPNVVIERRHSPTMHGIDIRPKRRRSDREPSG